MAYMYMRASLEAQRVKCLPAVWQTRVQPLGWDDPLEKEMAAHSSISAWAIPWMEEPGRLQSVGLQSDTTELLHFHFLICIEVTFMLTLSRKWFGSPWRKRNFSIELPSTLDNSRVLFFFFLILPVWKNRVELAGSAGVVGFRVFSDNLGSLTGPWSNEVKGVNNP